jgi:hypothetical protein
MNTLYLKSQFKQFLASTIAFIALVGFVSNSAEANMPVTFQAAAIKIKASDTKIISLDRGYQIDRITFQARKSLMANDSARLLLSVDGHHTLSVNVPKTGWRTYTATIADFAKFIEVRNISNNGWIKIRNITLLPRRIINPGPGHDYIPSGSDAYYQVAFIKTTTDYLYHVINQEDRVRFIDPFVIILGNSLSVLETSSDISHSARVAVENVVVYMDSIAPFLDQMLQTPALSDLARELKTTQRLLNRMLQN